MQGKLLTMMQAKCLIMKGKKWPINAGETADEYRNCEATNLEKPPPEICMTYKYQGFRDL